MSDSSIAPSSLRGAVARGALLAGGLLAAAAALRYLPFQEERALLADYVTGRGWQGMALFVLAGGLACGLGIPRQAISFAAGYVAGTWAGTLLALPAELIGAALNMAWAGTVARDWTRRHLPRRLAWLGGFLTRHPFSATLIIRLLPIGNNLALNILAGMLAIPMLPYLAASAIGYLPQTLIFVLFGSGARVAAATQIAIAIGLFVASALLGVLLLRRYPPPDK